MAKRYLMWILCAFVAALLLCTFLPMKIMLIGIGAILLVSVALIFFPVPQKQTILSCAISGMLAIFLFVGNQAWVQNLQAQLIDQEVEISGKITDLGRNSAGNYSLIELRLKEIDGKPLKSYQFFKVNLYTEIETAKIGDYIYGEVEFFDSSTEFGTGYENRVFISGFQTADKLTIAEPSGFSATAVLAQFQQTVRKRLSFGRDETVGLLESVCLGIKENLDSDLYVSLKRIGLSHVMAVSGLHLSFAVLLLQSFLMALGVDYRIRYMINIFVSIFFTALVGFPPSCVRACVMMVLYSFALAVGLFSDSLTSLSLAAFLLCLYNPFIVRDVGFLLSVAATAGIITLKLPIEHFLFPLRFEKPSWVNRIYRNFTGIFACSLAATIATLPIIIPVFKSVSVIGPFANVILLLPLQWFFMAGILMILLGWIAPIGKMIGFVCDVLYIPIKWIAQALGKFRFSSIDRFDGFGHLLMLLILAILAISVYHYLKYHRRSFMPLFSMLLIFSFLFGSIHLSAQKNDGVMIRFIDVGQGDCTVISKGNSAVILDYGGSSDKRYQLIECLKDEGINQVELLLFTHLHNDHINGLQTLLNNCYVDRIIYPEGECDNAYIHSLLIRENAQILEDDRTIEALGEVKIEPIFDASLMENGATDNENCICYRVSYGAVSVLITGDLQGGAEMRLDRERLDSTLLKVAHHGSDSSSYFPFLKAVSPQVAVISVGENGYGLPDKSVIERLKAICPNVCSTKEEGTISFYTNGKFLERVY